MEIILNLKYMENKHHAIIKIGYTLKIKILWNTIKPRIKNMDYYPKHFISLDRN